ncbi:Homeodomain-like protein [Raphanus sativus]|nr:Homeodomain-like protein [Raphanus sativus]
MQLNRELGLGPRRIKFWFQNRRIQNKAQQERVDSCALKEENDWIHCENIAIREAHKHTICHNCGDAPVHDDSLMNRSFESKMLLAFSLPSHVQNNDTLFIEKLLSGCPVLEDFTVCRVFDDSVPVQRVRSQCLKRFCVKFGRQRRIFGKEYAVGASLMRTTSQEK